MDDTPVTKVASIFGGPTGIPEVVFGCVQVITEAAEKAQAGEIVGVAMVMLHKDGLASWCTGGRIGGYGMIGAAQIVSARLTDIARAAGDE